VASACKILYLLIINVVDGSGKCPGQFQVAEADMDRENGNGEIVSPAVYGALFFHLWCG